MKNETKHLAHYEVTISGGCQGSDYDRTPHPFKWHVRGQLIATYQWKSGEAPIVTNDKAWQALKEVYKKIGKVEGKREESRKARLKDYLDDWIGSVTDG